VPATTVIVLLCSIGLSSCGSSNNTNTTTDNDTDQQADPRRLPSGGHLSNPEFQWPAVDNAGSYRLVILDDRNDRVSEQLTAAQANCEAANSLCRFTPSIQIHDSILKWRTQSFDSSGEYIDTSEDVAYNTLRSLTAQPYTELDTIGGPLNPGQGYPTIEFDNLVVLNNPWNSGAVNSDAWEQTVSVDRLTNGSALITFEYDWLNREDGRELEVKSYPQVIYGNKLGAHVSGTQEELGVPQTINALEEFKIDYRFTETNDPDTERNISFESFFHTTCDIKGPNFSVDDREYEMMVWVANPRIRTPGSVKAESGVIIDNQPWDVWIKPTQDDTYIAFKAINESMQGTLNWNRFIDWTVDWAATNTYGVKPLITDWCMSAIELGVETWWGKGKLQIDELNISRQ